MTVRICVTGIGVCSAIGKDLATFAANLAAGTGGIHRYDDVIEGHPLWAELVSDAAGSISPPAFELQHADRRCPPS